MRIASLIPSGTDIAAALGLEKYLVGVSHECDHPAAAGLPILTESLIPPSLTPSQIDEAVSASLQSEESNGSLYRTRRELLRELKPDIILTQDICDVCAVNAASVACNLPPGAMLVNLAAIDCAGLWADLRAVAAAANTDAEPLIAALQTRIEAVQAAVAGRQRPRVLLLEWSDPPYIGGHWAPEIIELAGGVHILNATREPSRRVRWQDIQQADPDIIILAPCGYDLQETCAQGRELYRNEVFLSLRAARENRVWATNATHLFSRCTPQTVRAVEVMAGVLHPEIWESPGRDEALPIV